MAIAIDTLAPKETMQLALSQQEIAAVTASLQELHRLAMASSPHSFAVNNY